MANKKQDGPALYGKDLFGEPYQPPVKDGLSEKFIIPPFSVLDARQGYWQERKRAWLALGIESELGRGADDLLGPAPAEGASAKYKQKELITNGMGMTSKKRYDKLSPGGSPRLAMDYSSRERGDGRGRPLGQAGNK